MRFDDSGMDTITGALILILACTVSSAILFSLPDGAYPEWLDTEKMEDQFDCILSSTIELNSSEGGNPAYKSTSLAAYLIDTPTEERPNGWDRSANATITNIIEFYFGRCDGWLLQIEWGDNCTKEIAARNQGAVGGSNVYVLERTVPDPEHGCRDIRLMIAG